MEWTPSPLKIFRVKSTGLDWTGLDLSGVEWTPVPPKNMHLAVFCKESIWTLGGDSKVLDPVGQDRYRGESEFQGLEGSLGSISEVPQDTLVGQPGKQNHDVGIIRNEAAVKISKAKK